jgi:uncharacterized membrane protein YjjP (DUF1212 family)
MANQGVRYIDQQQLRPELGLHELNNLEASVRYCAFFFLFSGASVMVLAAGDSSANPEHIFVGFLLFLLGSIMWLVQAFLLRRSTTALMVAGLVLAAFHKLFLACD